MMCAIPESDEGVLPQFSVSIIPACPSGADLLSKSKVAGIQRRLAIQFLHEG